MKVVMKKEMENLLIWNNISYCKKNYDNLISRFQWKSNILQHLIFVNTENFFNISFIEYHKSYILKVPGELISFQGPFEWW